MNQIKTTMVSTKDVFQLRLKPLVEQRIAKSKNHSFLNKQSQEKWQTYILAEMMKHLSFEQFIAITDDELRKLVGRRMSLNLVAGMLNDFTPEQMTTFNECLVRR